MSWLWILPILFLFDYLYLLLSKLNLPTVKLTLGRAVGVVFLAGFVYTVVVGAMGWIGWTKTPLLDFHNERLLPHFLVFLLGSQCYRLEVFNNRKKNMKRYIAVLATIWIPMNLYVLVLLNFFLRPGEFFFSGLVDGLLLWMGFHASVLGLLYCAVTTFKYFLYGQGRLGRVLARLSYNVYIIHVIVLGVIASMLIKTDIPGMLKYLILALTTYAGSNLIVFAYNHAVKRIGSRPS